MAFGDRFKDWFGWGDDDTVYEDESSFDDDLWADLGIDPDDDPDTWFDDLTTTITPTQDDDPYGIGSLFDFDSTPNIFDDEDWADTYDFGSGGGPAVDFGEEGFNFGDFDVDSYLDDLLNFEEDYTEDWGGIGTGYGDAFDFGGGDDAAFNEFISNFDFDDPKADWAGGIGDLFDFGGLGEGGDPDDRFDIGAGYDDAFGDIFGGDSNKPDGNLSLDELISLYGAGGTGGTGGTGTTPAASGIFSGDRFPKLAGFFNKLFGIGDKAIDTVGSGIGGLFNSKLGQLALLNYMRNKKESDIHVPIGYGDGGGGGGGDGSPIDYRVFNIQPALMPGVAYANVGKPEGMEHGGLGDVTLAKLEPGEFVVTKKAVDNIGAQNLYRMMKQAEGGG